MQPPVVASVPSQPGVVEWGLRGVSVVDTRINKGHHNRQIAHD